MTLSKMGEDKPNLLYPVIVVGLIASVGYIYFSQFNIPIVTLGDLRVEVVTDKPEYYLNESIEATLYFCNDRSRPVKIKMILHFSYIGYTEGDTERIGADVHISPAEKYFLIPANSRAPYFQATFRPRSPGEFVIGILGASVTVPVVGVNESTAEKEVEGVDN